MKISEQRVEYLDHMGSDLSVVNAARVSFAKTSEMEIKPEHKEYGFPHELAQSCFQLAERDVKLINYLAKHGHWSPFAHTSISLRIKAPIFVARQLVKHQVGLSWNEVSRRYVDDEIEWYVPDMWRKRAENIKQGSSQDDFGKPKRTGKCLYCGGELPQGRTKFCCDNHQVYHSQERLPFNTKFNRWKASAISKGITWDLVIDDLDWPKTCPYLDVVLNYGSDDKADNVASLDKIIPEKGYIKGNVQIISNLANRMKSSASYDQLLTFSKNAALLYGGVFVQQAPSYESFLEECEKTYYSLLRDGLAPEQARIFMPQSMMTSWIWTGSLMAFARVCKLRLDPHAQQETQEVAKMINDIVEPLFPVSWKALMG